MTFYRFPRGHGIHLRTGYPVEIAVLGSSAWNDAARRYKKVANAEVSIWKILMIAEKKFRCLNSPQLLAAVYDGQRLEDGMPAQEITRSAAPPHLLYTPIAVISRYATKSRHLIRIGMLFSRWRESYE